MPKISLLAKEICVKMINKHAFCLTQRDKWETPCGHTFIPRKHGHKKRKHPAGIPLCPENMGIKRGKETNKPCPFN
ncbi:hypothetical protein [Lacrimispora indolis]|uniref:hypothetical protein n=1 Tax=Lacrimispora indolis TaxID=69825 RepID=UPI00045E80A8|nr:hypothetical protein [Lacrimispora indolis]MBE7720208.1 hypothetical protein [Lacrimispora celerecrescens]